MSDRATMADLLVSVRSAADAAAALEGGCALVDVKEPKAGPLGRASDATIRAVIEFTAGRRPVSAAFGELAEDLPVYWGPGLAFAKWGLAGFSHGSSWQKGLLKAAKKLQAASPGCQPVAVAYADWRAAASPPPEVVADFTRKSSWKVLLLDTWTKDGRTLLEWMPEAEVISFCRCCQNTGIRVALAGSLGLDSIHLLRAAQPSWFAVRTAACRDGQRDGIIDTDRVRQLVDVLSEWDSAATSGSSGSGLRPTLVQPALGP
jgi:uncharacterized protein (UPF0264 family)